MPWAAWTLQTHNACVQARYSSAQGQIQARLKCRFAISALNASGESPPWNGRLTRPSAVSSVRATRVSTLLDAIEATLSPRWFSFAEPDFLFGDTSESIVIETTLGELSSALKSDQRFGLYVRGWTSESSLRDEPEGDDEPVLTIRLTVDATTEPVWQLVCDRIEDPRTLSNRDRALFGLVRLSGDDARHLAWGQGSILARATGKDSDAAASLADAY